MVAYLNEEVLPLNYALLEELLQRLSDHVLVVVVVGAVDKSDNQPTFI